MFYVVSGWKAYWFSNKGVDSFQMYDARLRHPYGIVCVSATRDELPAHLRFHVTQWLVAVCTIRSDVWSYEEPCEILLCVLSVVDLRSYEETIRVNMCRG